MMQGVKPRILHLFICCFLINRMSKKAKNGIIVIFGSMGQVLRLKTNLDVYIKSCFLIHKLERLS
jgi:hypothetical protein